MNGDTGLGGKVTFIREDVLRGSGEEIRLAWDQVRDWELWGQSFTCDIPTTV